MRSAYVAYSRFCDAVERVTNFLLVALLTALIFMVSAQVVARYVMEQPWLWTIDYAIFCLVWSTFLAAGVGVRHNSHYAIDLWPPRWRTWSVVLTWVALAVVMLMGAMYLWKGWEFAAVSGGRLAGMTGTKMVYFLASVPFGGALVLLFALEQALARLAGMPRPTKGESL